MPAPRDLDRAGTAGGKNSKRDDCKSEAQPIVQRIAQPAGWVKRSRPILEEGRRVAAALLIEAGPHRGNPA